MNVFELSSYLRRNWRKAAFEIPNESRNRHPQRYFKPGPQYFWFEENILSYPFLTKAIEFRESIVEMEDATVPSIHVFRELLSSVFDKFVRVKRSNSSDWEKFPILKEGLITDSVFRNPKAPEDSKVIVYFRDMNLSEEQKDKYLIMSINARALGSIASDNIYILRSSEETIRLIKEIKAAKFIK
jgi:hypothetical protein